MRYRRTHKSSGRETKPRTGIEKGPDAEQVARREQALPVSVPNCKCEIADDLLCALVAPTLIRQQYKFGIRESTRNESLAPQRSAQLISIVDAPVEGKDKPAIVACKRLPLEDRLRSSVERKVRKADFLSVDIIGIVVGVYRKL